MEISQISILMVKFSKARSSVVPLSGFAKNVQKNPKKLLISIFIR